MTQWQKEYQDCLLYIDSFWDRVTHHPEKKVINHHTMHIPCPYITPNVKWLGKQSYMFYWDTFFIFRGLMGTKREVLLKDMVNNFMYLFDKYGIIPNFNAPVSMGRSQPPFFTSMILDTYNRSYFAYLKAPEAKKRTFKKVLDKEKKWLTQAISIAKKEYNQIWQDPERYYNHSVSGHLLNRYGDRDIGYAHSSELESGWDFTSRFYNRCNEFLPIDLNVLLFKYERDFAKLAEHLGNNEDMERWWAIAQKRKKEINRLMWNKEGFFFDYCYTDKKQSTFLSLAGFTPLWAGLATAQQAKQMVEKLPYFETEYALTITAKESLAPYIDMRRIPSLYRPAIEAIITPKQWDYPNAWPPLDYLTVIGLLKYGYIEDAYRIMSKFIKTHASLFRTYGTFFEKVDGVEGKMPKSYHYANQSGFGWTNAVFYRYIHILESIDNKENIYQEPKAAQPPFKLAIIH